MTSSVHIEDTRGADVQSQSAVSEVMNESSHNRCASSADSVMLTAFDKERIDAIHSFFDEEYSKLVVMKSFHAREMDRMGSASAPTRPCC